MTKEKKLSREYRLLAENTCGFCKHKGLEDILDKNIWIFYCANCKRIIIAELVTQKIIGVIKLGNS